MKLLALSLIFSFATLASYQHCFELTQKENEKCLTKVSNIHPTQFSLGMVAIPKKKKKFEKYYRKGKLNSKLMEKLIPAVIGPDQKTYILDGHHSSFALSKADIPQEEKIILTQIVKDCSNCTDKEFKDYMTQDGNSYLYSKDFEKRGFYELPDSLNSLTDNPHRSLAWMLRKEECFVKVKVNFLEFIWGKALKSELEHRHIYLANSNKDQLKSLIQLGCKIVKNEKYSSFPGYVSNL